MPISDAKLKSLMEQGKAVAVTPDVTDNPSQEVKASARPELTSGEYLLTSAREGLADFTGRLLEAARTAGAGENVNVAMLRLLAPRFISNAGSNLPKQVLEGLTDPFNQPNSPENLKEAVSVNSASGWEKNPETGKMVFREAEAPGPWSRVIGAGVRSAADPANYIFGGPAGKTALGSFGKLVGGNFGAGITAEEFGQGGASLGRTVGGETGEKVGRVLGSLAGGAVGFQVGAAGREITGAGYDAYRAGKSAIQQKRDGDSQSIFKIVSDNFAGLRATAKEYAADEVMRRVHEILKNNPNVDAKTIQQFDDMLKRNGINPALFDLGQRTNDPTIQLLTKMAKERAPDPRLSQIETQAAQAREQAVRAAEKSAWEKILPGEAKSFITTLKDTWNNVQLNRQALLRNFEDLFEKRLANLADPRKKVETGALMQSEAEKILDNAKQEGGRLYEEAFRLADEAGVPVNVTSLAKEQRDFLKTINAQVGTGQQVVPQSYRSILGVFNRKQAQDKSFLDSLLSGNTAEGEAKISLRDAGDILRQINRDLPGLLQGENTREAGRQLTAVKDHLINLIQAEQPEHVVKAFNDARNFWRFNVGETFREGLNRDLMREGRSGARTGISAIDPALVVDRFINPPGNTSQVTAMNAFNRMFAGAENGGVAGTRRNEQMYKLLGDHIEDAYRLKVFQRDRLLAKDPEFLPREHAAFLERNAAAIDNVPGLRDKLNGIGQKAQRIKGQIDLEARRFEDMVTGPIAQTMAKQKGDLSQDQVGTVMAHILNSPQAMSSFLEQSRIAGSADLKRGLIKEIWARTSPWDTSTDSLAFERLDKLLTSGKVGEVPAVQRLFEATFGKEQAKKHIQSLTELGEIHRRALATDPRFAKIQEGLNQDGVKESTGTSVASAINDIRSMAQGRTTPLYTIGSMLSRYANQKMQDAWKDAQYEAFFTPSQSSLIVEAYKAGLDGRRPSEKLIEALASKMGKEAGDELRAAYAKSREVGGSTELLSDAERKAAGLAAIGAKKAKEDMASYLAVRQAKGLSIGATSDARNREGEVGESKQP